MLLPELTRCIMFKAQLINDLHAEAIGESGRSMGAAWTCCRMKHTYLTNIVLIGTSTPKLRKTRVDCKLI